MTRFEAALLTIARVLETSAVPYMVIGGVANPIALGIGKMWRGSSGLRA